MSEVCREATILSNETILREWYPGVGEYDAQDHMYVAIQSRSLTLCGNWKWMRDLQAMLQRCFRVQATGPSDNLAEISRSERPASLS